MIVKDMGMQRRPHKVLIFRFSSFGDVLQSLSLIGKVKDQWPEAEVHFCTRKEFVPLAASHAQVSQVWSLDKAAGVSGLMALAADLKNESWTHIYDCHNNLRSRALSFLLNGPFGVRKSLKGHQFLRRPIYRFKRFLLFQIGWNLFPKPFSGQGALIEPLTQWGFSKTLPGIPQLYFPSHLKSKAEDSLNKLNISLPEKYIALAPSAAHKLKRWPIEHFKTVIEKMPQTRFVILGGPEDSFLSELENKRVINLAGKISLEESAFVVDQSQLLLTNDTGLMHVAEQRGVPCVALMGPAPFGFPSRVKTKILEKNLKCRPCSKHGQGPCVNKETYQKCLVDITPDEVVRAMEVQLGGLSV